MTDTLPVMQAARHVALPEVILATKLYIPKMRPNLVPRPNLVDKLSAALTRMPGVILISASPGFGKTTLLSEWINSEVRSKEYGVEDQHQDSLTPYSLIPTPKVAWLALDEDDNNPRRFLSYCVAALQTVHPGVGQSAIAMLQSDSAPPTADTLVTTLINEIAAVPTPFIFIFDDYHVIENPLLHQSLAYLLDNLPPQVQLVIATRTDPPLPLARWRGRGQLTKLGATDLRFSPGEVATFLNNVMGLRLSPPEITALEERTEGWIAGLQMAALSMQGLKDTAGFVQAFTGSHRHILDYLLEEVLNRQPPQVQRFLLQTSILERLCGPLCDQLVSGFKFQGSSLADNSKPETQNSKPPDNSQEILEYLEAANLFIIPLDDERRWYRYHHLFADLLRRRLEQTTSPTILPPGGIAALHRRASQWFEQNGLPTEAMGHALAAVDVERIVRLARQKAATMLSRTELVTLLSWLDTLPHALTRSQPHLSLLHAWAMVLTGQLQAVEPYLQEAERGHTDLPDREQIDIPGEVATIRAAVAYFQRDMQQAINLYQQALTRLSPDNLFLRGIVMQCLGAAYSWSGNVVEATPAFSEASTISQSTGNFEVALIALWNLAQLQVEQGNLRQATEVYRQALQLVEAQPDTRQEHLRPYVGRVYIGLAEVLYQQNKLESAAGHAQTGIQLGEQTQESGTLTGGYLALARIAHAQGDSSAAQEAVQKAQHFARQYVGLRYLVTQVATCQARLWLSQNNLRAAANWVQSRELQLDPPPKPIPYLREEEYLVLVRLLLAQRQQQPDEPVLPVGAPLEVANKVLARLVGAAKKSQRTGRVIEGLGLQALVLQAQDHGEQALAALKEALALAQPEDYIRCFVDEGLPMANLLRRAVDQKIAPGYVAQLLAAFRESPHLSVPQSPQLLDPLSEREFEILQLIATGKSNRQLAEELVVTVGTVKWHLNNIYSKLGVRSRTQAVARARELGLL